MPLIVANGLSLTYGGSGLLRRGGGVKAVSDVDIEIAGGSALGLVGESGSGKSTIGRLLLGLLQPTGGHVVFDGHDLAKLGPAASRKIRQRMQLVFQDPLSSLDSRRRVGAQIADGLAIHKLLPRRERAKRVEDLLTTVGLEPAHAARYPHEFSGGQRQRIAIARSLATNPDFLVADEPVSALDVSVQAQIVSLLADLRTRLGLTLLFISHDLDVVRFLCDRIVVLYLGRVMEEGPSEAVFRSPRHPYTRTLLAAVPRLNSRARQIGVPRGEPPSPSNPPSGCVFRTRCPYALPDCANAVPPLEQRGPNHRAACIRHDIDALPAAQDEVIAVGSDA